MNFLALVLVSLVPKERPPTEPPAAFQLHETGTGSSSTLWRQPTNRSSAKKTDGRTDESQWSMASCSIARSANGQFQLAGNQLEPAESSISNNNKPTMLWFGSTSFRFAIGVGSIIIVAAIQLLILTRARPLASLCVQQFSNI